MGLFKKKRRKKQLFGANIAPNCTYCQHNHGVEREVICSLKKTPEDHCCKKFIYDPLKRKPKVAPALNKTFKKEDFQL